jgi:hypothetical protein
LEKFMTFLSSTSVACLGSLLLFAGSPWAAAQSLTLPETKLCAIEELLVSTDFDQPTALGSKGRPGTWQGGIGKWSIDAGVLHGSELVADHHHASCTYRTQFQDVVIAAQFKLGKASQIAFGCRDDIPPNHHLARVFISPTGLWVQRMSGIAKTTRAEKLSELPASFAPEQWYDIVIEICADQYLATVGGHTIQARHERFRDTKGLVALIVKGDDAQFRQLRIWRASAKP